MHQSVNQVSKEEEKQRCHEDVEASILGGTLWGEEMLADEKRKGETGDGYDGWCEVGAVSFFAIVY